MVIIIGAGQIAIDNSPLTTILLQFRGMPTQFLSYCLELVICNVMFSTKSPINVILSVEA